MERRAAAVQRRPDGAQAAADHVQVEVVDAKLFPEDLRQMGSHPRVVDQIYVRLSPRQEIGKAVGRRFRRHLPLDVLVQQSVQRRDLRDAQGIRNHQKPLEIEQVTLLVGHVRIPSTFMTWLGMRFATQLLAQVPAI